VASARAAGCVVVGVPHIVELPAGAVDAVVPTLEGLDLAGLRRLYAAATSRRT
jgi:hypothetical protein